MKHILSTCALAAATVAAIPATAQTAPAAPAAPATKAIGISDDVIRIGVLTDLSGLFSDFAGKGSIAAVKMAVDEMGGQINGRKIEIVTADHQNKADVASAKAREWFDSQKVDMITDLVGSAPSLAVAEIGKQKQKVVMVSGAYSPRLTNESCSPTTAHWQLDTVALASTPKFLVKQGMDSWYFVSADYAFGQAMEQDATKVIEAAGGKVVGSVKHPFNAPDFSSYMLRAQSSGAKAIALANAGGDMINAVKAANEFGVNKSGKQNVIAMAFLLTDVHALGLPLAQGLYTIEGFYWDSDPASRQFGERFYKEVKKMPTAIQAAGYSAALTYLKAVKAAGTDDALTVMKQMRSMPIEDVYAGRATLREDGRLMKDMMLVQVKKPGDSKKPWDYYDIRAKVTAEEAFQPLSKSACPTVQKSVAQK
ncbi:ABC transporter substrate-binding protein [Variovorax sp. KK3]|uniref:ABC transporter substrate-binding protein n=1 Tax=Variovorax sp. KK3 TaxID=1855728 RepID=UPI00097C0E84|nr:ABC transporter substrate-binding protein [Variovorax sp. KK3]